MRRRGGLGSALLVAAATLTGCSSAPPTEPAAPEASPSEPEPAAPDEAVPEPALLIGQPAPASDAPAPAPVDLSSALGTSLAVTPRVTLRPKAQITAAQTSELRLELRIENTGTESIAAPWAHTELLMNGSAMTDWPELRKTLPEKSIASKQAVEMSYEPSDKAVLKPGKYEFVLVVGKARSEPAVLTVTEK